MSVVMFWGKMCIVYFAVLLGPAAGSDPNNGIYVYGSDVTLLCGVFGGTPPYTFTWNTPDGAPFLSNTTTNDNSIEVTFSALHNHTGSFICTVSDASMVEKSSNSEPVTTSKHFAFL